MAKGVFVDRATGERVERDLEQQEIEALQETDADRIVRLNARAQRNRLAAFQVEADPLFFAWQRGEGTEADWLDKCAEIRARYPYT